MKVTRDNIQKFYVTRKGQKHYFNFPDKGQLVVEVTGGAAQYWKGWGKSAFKQMIFDEAYAAYKEHPEIEGVTK